MEHAMHDELDEEVLRSTRTFVLSQYEKSIRDVDDLYQPLSSLEVAQKDIENDKVRQLTDRVMAKELDLVMIKIQREEEDIGRLKERKIGLGIRVERAKELTKVFRNKLSETRAILNTLSELQREAKAPFSVHEKSVVLESLHELKNVDVSRFENKRNQNTQLNLRDVLSDYDNLTKQNESNASISSYAERSVAEDLAQGQAIIQKKRFSVDGTHEKGQIAVGCKLLERMSHCITKFEADVRRAISEIVCAKKAVQFHEDWASAAVEELRLLQEEEERFQAETARREQLLTEAREQSELLEKMRFLQRKEYIMAHRRLTGKEQHSELLDRDSVALTLETIQNEIRMGSTTTLDRLAANECASLRQVTSLLMNPVDTTVNSSKTIEMGGSSWKEKRRYLHGV